MTLGRSLAGDFVAHRGVAEVLNPRRAGDHAVVVGIWRLDDRAELDSAPLGVQPESGGVRDVLLEPLVGKVVCEPRVFAAAVRDELVLSVNDVVLLLGVIGLLREVGVLVVDEQVRMQRAEIPPHRVRGVTMPSFVGRVGV